MIAPGKLIPGSGVIGPHTARIDCTALGWPEHYELCWVSLGKAEDLLPPRLAVIFEWVKHTLAGY